MLRPRMSKEALAAVIAVCSIAWAPIVSADRHYHTGFGETLGEVGCDKSHGMVLAFHQTAENMREMKDIPRSKMDETVIREYLQGNLRLDDLPKDSSEYRIFSRMAELIMAGEDRETVEEQTMEVCQREFGSP